MFGTFQNNWKKTGKLHSRSNVQQQSYLLSPIWIFNVPTYSNKIVKYIKLNNVNWRFIMIFKYIYTLLIIKNVNSFLNIKKWMIVNAYETAYVIIGYINQQQNWN